MMRSSYSLLVLSSPPPAPDPLVSPAKLLVFTVRRSAWGYTSERWEPRFAPPFDATAAGSSVVLLLEPPASSAEGKGLLGVVAPEDACALDLLEVVAEWLGEASSTLPLDSVSVEGAHLVLSTSHPDRTLAEAGIGRPITPAEAAAAAKGADLSLASAVPCYRVMHLPFCLICHAVPSSARYGCRALSPHRFCRACAVRYVQGILASSHHLRCPFPDCSCTLETEALASVIKKVCAARDARLKQQAARLARVRSGEEGADLQGLLAGGWRGSAVRPCPRCSVLTFKDGARSGDALRCDAYLTPLCAGGCPHVTCAVCGQTWDWT